MLQRVWKKPELSKRRSIGSASFLLPCLCKWGLDSARPTGTKKAPVSKYQDTGAMRLLLICWWTRQESNLEPAGYEPEALPIELRVRRKNLLCPVPVFCQDKFFERIQGCPKIAPKESGFLCVTPRSPVERTISSPCTRARAFLPHAPPVGHAPLSFSLTLRPHAKLPCTR